MFLTPMTHRRLALLLLAAVGFGATVLAGTRALHAQAPGAATPPVRPVADVDIDRYVGRWYEIARFPNRFQKKCTGNVSAVYSRRPDGRIDVRNSCTTADGHTETSGIARRADRKGPPSVLEVRFAPAILSFLPSVWGDYWILDLSDDYDTAVVGSPDREYLWFLARTPSVDQATFARMTEAARAQGFDVDRLERTRQDAAQ